MYQEVLGSEYSTGPSRAGNNQTRENTASGPACPCGKPGDRFLPKFKERTWPAPRRNQTTGFQTGSPTPGRRGTAKLGWQQSSRWAIPGHHFDGKWAWLGVNFQWIAGFGGGGWPRCSKSPRTDPNFTTRGASLDHAVSDEAASLAYCVQPKCMPIASSGIRDGQQT